MSWAAIGGVPRASLVRVGAMSLRHLYLLRGSWTRLAELAYWPTVQMVLWGFITQFLATQSSYIANAFGVLLSGVLLWDILFRGQLGVCIPFLEEMWSRNLGHMFVSPIRPWEMIVGFLAVSLARTVLGVVPATLLAIVFYGFSVYSLGLPLIAFFFNLIVFGWAIGLALNGLVLRFGLGAETLAWVVIMAVAPISGVYYPVASLPSWLQLVSWCLPSAYVFEGMRAVLIDGWVRLDVMLWAGLLNLGYLAAGAGIFLYCLRAARDRGLILQIGE
ncbi:MAG: ABC transporter permease [Alphaproteobacteria bacterium]|nr:ABC transporter permease [Alphaproteobacteria bacterium]